MIKWHEKDWAEHLTDVERTEMKTQYPKTIKFLLNRLEALKQDMINLTLEIYDGEPGKEFRTDYYLEEQLNKTRELLNVIQSRYNEISRRLYILKHYKDKSKVENDLTSPA